MRTLLFNVTLLLFYEYVEKMISRRVGYTTYKPPHMENVATFYLFKLPSFTQLFYTPLYDL